MRQIVESYLAIAEAHGLPMLLTSPTWRCQPDRVAQSRYRGQRVNRDGVEFVREIAARARVPVQVAGLMGPRGDCYRPEEAPSEQEATAFHREQASELAESGVDWILAATLPSLCEAKGLACLREELGVPLVLSFVLDPEGRLLDGCSLAEAIAALPCPVMLNCTHWSFAWRALAQRPGPVLGLQANTAACHPQDLDGSATLRAESPAAFAEGMTALVREFGLRLAGGCCGTSVAHMEALAAKLTAP